MCHTFMIDIQKIEIRYAKNLNAIGHMKTNKAIINNEKKNGKFGARL